MPGKHGKPVRMLNMAGRIAGVGATELSALSPGVSARCCLPHPCQDPRCNSYHTASTQAKVKLSESYLTLDLVSCLCNMKPDPHNPETGAQLLMAKQLCGTIVECRWISLVCDRAHPRYLKQWGVRTWSNSPPHSPTRPPHLGNSLSPGHTRTYLWSVTLRYHPS